ncbi:MAG: alpha-1,4-glucan--maltose-1-phosphate maltosyltransferase [Deltaproteobacteria bacterium]|nr:alpha-1,4-glucan--maltose-1-phosphate maltosyltransferase [Deltaproteobacteria bacterium]
MVAIKQTRIVIENVSPSVDHGRFAVKVVTGDQIEVGADIWKDGHEILKAAVLWRKVDNSEISAICGPRSVHRKQKWNETLLTTSFDKNDRWNGRFNVDSIGPWVYTIVAWTDLFASWRDEIEKKVAAGNIVKSELLEGLALIERVLATLKGKAKTELNNYFNAWRKANTDDECLSIARDKRLVEFMARHDPRFDAEYYDFELPLWVDRERARYGSWYELFPRSCGTDKKRSATFREAEKRLPQVAAMGFNVLYLPPIHPIGSTARKGKNNTSPAKDNDPGSPWAIGSSAGGHDAVHPDLGTIDDFDHYCATARQLGLEIALDFAVQCSPDHPWVKEHPQWFAHRPDGTIKYAENPPKKYQDIYPIDFETIDREGLYHGLLEILRFWISHGVKIFRVDNPHTKAHSFWEWLINEVHRQDPDVLFLAEAFTRPKRMRRLAKLGFTQSYSYFTWRNTRSELEEYATELFLSDVGHYLRPNFFTNTPDILHEILQKGGRPAFITRLVLAATLSPTYGIYSGFELCENQAVHEGSEEYLDSEKYEIRIRNWQQPGNIIDLVKIINQLRKKERALQLANNLRFLPVSNPQIIAYAKITPGSNEHIICVVNVDPHHLQEGFVTIPDELRQGAWAYNMRDLINYIVYRWEGPQGYVRLDPKAIPMHVFKIAAK